MQKSNVSSMTEFALFHSYYTSGGDKKVLLPRRNALQRVNQELFMAMMNFINAPDGDDEVSKHRRRVASDAYVTAFTKMKERQVEKPATSVTHAVAS